METMAFGKTYTETAPGPGKTVLVGVVASGNLEVMVESQPLDRQCRIEISTSARGFGTIWHAVITDFFERHELGNTRISINDAGASPAVVSLRLDQAARTFLEGAK